MYKCPLCNYQTENTDYLKKTFCKNCKGKKNKYSYICPICKIPLLKIN